MAAAICDAKSLRYVLGKCKDCNAFTKIDKLKIESLKCCIKKAAKGWENGKTWWVGALIEIEAKGLSPLSHNVKDTSKVYDELMPNLVNHTIVKKHDFSEKLYMLIARWDPEPPLDTRYGNCIFCGGSEDVCKDHIPHLAITMMFALLSCVTVVCMNIMRSRNINNSWRGVHME